MIDKTAELLGIEPFDVFQLAMENEYGDMLKAIHAFTPKFVYECYVETGFIPDYIVRWCSQQEASSHD